MAIDSERIVITHDGMLFKGRVAGSPGFVWGDSEQDVKTRIRRWSWDQHRKRLFTEGKTHDKDLCSV